MSPMKSSRVTVLSKLTAVSSEPVSPGMTHRFSALDHAMALHSLHVIFYYRTNPFGSFDLNPVRVNLADALSMYPPVTGRLLRRADGDWEVKCNDAGVRVLRAEVGTTLDEWLRSADGAEERDLTAWDSPPDDPTMWSPFRIQINEFEEGGVAVGVSCLHMHADPTCATLLFNSWSRVHRRLPVAHPPVFQPLSALLHTSPSPPPLHHYATKSKSSPSPPSQPLSSTATFCFSSSIIAQSIDKHPSNNATPFAFLAALFWTRIAHLKAPGRRPSHLSLCVDFRKLMETPLPFGYFGNALHFSKLAMGEEGDDVELEDVVRMVHDHVSSLGDDEVRAGVGWLEARRKAGGGFASPFAMYGPELTCVSMEHMIEGADESSLVYANAFEEGGEPVHVSYRAGNVEGEGMIVVMPSPERGMARRVAVTLPEEEMIKLCEDEVILNLKPTMLLSGRV